MKHLLSFLALSTLTLAFGQAGHIDTTFNSFPGNTGYNDVFSSQQFIRDIAIQPDGKYLLSGLMYHYDGEDRHDMVRLNADGTLDDSFVYNWQMYLDEIRTILPLPNGKIVIGGGFNQYGPTYCDLIGMMLPDGSPDPTFTAPLYSFNSTEGTVMDMLLHTDGDIVFAGNFSGTSEYWYGAQNIAKIHQNGTYDELFTPTYVANTGYNAIALLPGGDILAGGFIYENEAMRTYLVRLSSTGALVADLWGSNSPEGEIKDIALGPNGEIYIAGTFEDHLVRINNDGSINATFTPSFAPFTTIYYEEPAGIYELLVQPDGKVVVGGNFGATSEITCVGRLNTNGSWDNTFAIGEGTHGRVVNALALAANGNLAIGGSFQLLNITGRNNIAAVDPNGNVLPGFANITGAGNVVSGITIRPDHKILITGMFEAYNSVPRDHLALLNEDGTLDESFVLQTPFTSLHALGFQPDNKLLAGGLVSLPNGTVVSSGLARYNADGSPDPSFSTGTGLTLDASAGSYPFLRKFLVQSDGKIIITGRFNSYNGTPVTGIARLYADGTLDPTFSCTLDGYAGDIIAQPDGKFLLTGFFSTCNGTPHLAMARINPDGSTDETFHSPQLQEYTRMALQPDGKIIVGGGVVQDGVVTSIGRLNANGSVDATFDAGTGFDEDIADFILQPDGKVIVGGHNFQYNGTAMTYLIRLNPDGTPDPSFLMENGMADGEYSSSYFRVYCLALQADGNVLIGGEFMNYDGVRRNHLARLQNDVTGYSDIHVTFSNAANVSCTANGSATVNATGGTAPYTYEWNTTETDQTIALTTGGVYHVTVTDANGGTGSASLLIDSPTTAGLDMGVNLHATAFRTGFPATVWIDASNSGCMQANGQLKLAFDPLLNFVSAVPAPASINGDTLIWDFSNMTHDSPHLAPHIEFEVSVAAAIGDSIELLATVTPVTGDVAPANNSKAYSLPVINGYDPNTKAVYPVGKCDVGYIDQQQTLTYTVHFQNTGNSEAINISVTDQLDPDLDLNTLRIVGKSHDMWLEILPGNILKFHFDGINLPDSTSNEPASHGYVIYEVTPVTSWIDHNTAISNVADIYFDFNPAVVTNTVHNHIFQGDLENFNCLTAGIEETAAGTLLLYPNPNSGTFTVETQQALTVAITSVSGQLVHQQLLGAGKNQLTLGNVESGIYFLVATDENGSHTMQRISITR